MRLVGVVGSGATATWAPLIVYEEHERWVREEQLVLIEDSRRNAKFLGVLRRVARYDPFLVPYRRTAYVDSPHLADEGSAAFGTSGILVVGELVEGIVKEPTLPPNPGSRVSVVEGPDELGLRLGGGLVVGRHKYSGLELPLRPEFVHYHVAIVGGTGSGKSRLALALVQELLAKTNYTVVIFDHTGVDYVPFLPREKVVDGSEVLLTPDVIAELMLNRTGLYRERTTYEKYFLFTTVYYLAWRAGMVDHEAVVRQLQQARRVRSFRQEGSELIRQLGSLDYSELLNRMANGVEWEVEGYKEALRAIRDAIGGRESAEVRALLSIDLKLGRSFFESLSRRRLHPRSIVERALRDKLVVVDLSSDFDTVTKQHVISSTISEAWRLVEERRRPLNLVFVVDEAHNYANSSAYGCFDEIERTAREGRKWGLGLVLVTQRVIDIDPKVRGNVNTVFFSRLQTQNDFKELAGYIDLGGITEASLSVLGQREFYVAGLMNPLRTPMLLRVREVGHGG